MDCEKEISLRVEKIKTIFQTSQELATNCADFDKLIPQLNQTEPEFRSVAYEGASMTIALRDLLKDNVLTTWNTFNKKAPSHCIQIHVGLGWAIAQQNYAVLPPLGITDPLLSSRVLDGHGYYDGIFRQRNTIKNQKISEAIKPQMLSSYDQGLGRSLWYISKGDVNKVLELISGFSSDRHPALWTGIGVSCAYVGGSDKILLHALFAVAQHYQNSLATGATLAARSRIQAGLMTKDVELACNTWHNFSDDELWLTQLEKVLIPSHNVTAL